MTIEEDKARYTAAMHGVQTGVMYQMQVTNECDPKHLRVGINSAMVNDGALVTLLIEKGTITEEEYFAKLAYFAELELADYQERVKAQFGGNADITLA